MNKKYTLFIGSNNETGLLEQDKIIDTVKTFVDGFTFSAVKGYWKAKQEDTLKVEISTPKAYEAVLSLCRELKSNLKQDSIMLETSGSVDFV